MSISQNIEITGRSNSGTKRKKLTASVWDHYNVVEEDNQRRKAICKICGKGYLADSTSGTSNLKRHMKKHGTKLDSEHARFASISQDIYREKIASSIVKHDYPFMIVEHEGLRDVHAYLNPSVKTICRNTAKADVLKLYKKVKENVRKELDGISGRLCLTSDIWTSITSDGYMSLTAHYVDSDWKLQNKLLVFHHVSPPHNGPLLADRLFEFLKEWGIEKKVLTITLDNAAYNDRAVRSLKAYFDIEGSSIHDNEFLHVRCGAHILNLIVRSGLELIEDVIYKIRESVKYLKGSEGRMKRFYTYVKQLSLVTNKKLTQDVTTRWNSTYIMLERAIIFKDAFNQLHVLDDDYEFCPSEDEWSRVEKLARFLKPFYEITTLFSGRKYPTANLYFENVCKIQILLNREVNSEDYLMREMAISMNEKFLKYWKCYSMVLSFAVVLDPRFKLGFVEFCFHKLDPRTMEENVKLVKEKLTRLFEEYSRLGYASSSQPSPPSPRDNINIDTDDLTEDFDSYQSQYGVAVGKSELELYLEEQPINRKQNPNLDVLSFWKDNMTRYPELSLLARDILSIPITTVASEYAFSHGGRILGTYRTSILPDNIEAILCCRDWLSNNADVSTNEEEEGALTVDLDKLIREQASMGDNFSPSLD